MSVLTGQLENKLEEKVIAIKLNDPWFSLVLSGRKKYEGRRRFGQITTVRPGDVLEIGHYTDPTVATYRVRVEEVLPFGSFEDALKVLPIEEVLPLPGITVEKGIKIYLKYVSRETQKRDGILMFRLVVC